jgi:serine/threonine protein kinase
LHFTITAKLGEGGMGEVYRAEDTKLGREVAIKVLPEAVAADPERLARFEREAKVLASLNHPNIAAIYAIESTTAPVDPDARLAPQEEGEAALGERPDHPVHFLVMELVEGEDLKERLERGALPYSTVQPIALQVAEALEVAHEKGIIHRDLKPANIKVTPEGQVKVLDFGLAKAMDPAVDNSKDLSLSPTLTAQMTGAGVLLGTAAYMSPEQARGQEVDKRTDIWAFGCLLYEMLSATPTFGGDTVSDVLARILEREVDFDQLPNETPTATRRLLRRCLEKDPARRLRDIGDARWELTETEEDSLAAAGDLPTSNGRSLGMLAAVFATGLLAGGGLLWLLGSRPDSGPAVEDQPVSKFVLEIPPSDQYSTLQNAALTLSPDGQALAYAAKPADATAVSELYFRRFDSFEVESIPDTLQAYAPFFSPDGDWLGYFQDSGLWKKPIRGGPAVKLAPVAGMARGGSWTEDDRIFYAPTWFSPILEVPAGGGEAREVTTLLEGEKSHRFPSASPDGSILVFTVGRADIDTFDDAAIVIQSTQSGERRTLVDGGSFGRLLPPDRLLFGRAGTLYVGRLDATRLELVGSPVPILDDLLTSPTFGSSQFAVSSTGTLAYLAGSPDLFNSRAVEISRTGEISDLPLAPQPFTMVRFSPDGRKLAVRIDGANGQLWIYDLARGTLSRITREWDADFPTWHPTGESIAYVLSKGGSSEIAQVATDGTGEPEILWSGTNLTFTSWAPDGRSLVFTDAAPATGYDIWVLNVDPEPRVAAYLQTPAEELDAMVSPDGKWLAYTSDESGRNEIYVQAYPVPGRRWQISARGGQSANWSAADSELIFSNGDEIMAVPVETGAQFNAGIPRLLFKLPNMSRGDDTRSFDVSSDGRYVGMIPPEDWQPTGRLHLILNWASTLE